HDRRGRWCRRRRWRRRGRRASARRRAWWVGGRAGDRRLGCGGVGRARRRGLGAEAGVVGERTRGRPPIRLRGDRPGAAPGPRSEEVDVDLYEYQGRELFARHGLPVLGGGVAATPDEAREIAERLGGRVVVKAQVKTGGRGKAGGVKLAETAEEAQAR